MRSPQLLLTCWTAVLAASLAMPLAQQVVTMPRPVISALPAANLVKFADRISPQVEMPVTVVRTPLRIVAACSPVPEYPLSTHDFFLTTVPQQNTFVTNEQGDALHVVHHQNGRNEVLDRIDNGAGQVVRRSWNNALR